MKILAALCLITSTYFHIAAQSEAENMQFGLHVSPVTSWISTNDARIVKTDNNTGLRIGIVAQKYLGDNYGFTGMLSFALDQGGTLEYAQGGNFLPKSDLSNPAWNRGDKPLPDDVEITYHMTFFEARAAFRLRTNEIGSFRIFTEFPALTLGLATNAKGDIDGSGIDAVDEPIGPDLRNLMFSWGAGAGIELSLGESIMLAPGVFFQQTLLDVTRNRGHVAVELIDDQGTPDPSDDDYRTEKEDSKGKLGSLTIRIAIMF